MANIFDNTQTMYRCRLCLDRPGGMVRIDEDVFGRHLEMLFHVQFPANGYVPDKVCDRCVTKVHEYYSFYQQVIRAQQLLQTEKERVIRNRVKADSIHLIASDEANDSKHYNHDEAIETHDTKNILLKNGATDYVSTDYVDRKPAEEKISIITTNNEHDEQSQEIKVDGKIESFEAKSQSNIKYKSTANDKKNAFKKQIEDNDRIREFFSIVCEICSKEFSTFQRLQTHSRKAHHIRGFIVCCNQKFFRTFRVLDHIAFHLKPDAFRCELCEKNYRSRYTLQEHNKSHHAEPKERPFKCNQCHQSV
uniref:Transcription factor grauzone n=1 Tax=Anopheles gambiae TaxID=7165 RepID=A0A1S4GM63_ANOGA